MKMTQEEIDQATQEICSLRSIDYDAPSKAKARHYSEIQARKRDIEMMHIERGDIDCEGNGINLLETAQTCTPNQLKSAKAAAKKSSFGSFTVKG